MMADAYDLVVIGAGPAGMAAAATACTAGARVLVLDDQSTPGGQIYRAVENAGNWESNVLGPDYIAGKANVRTFRDSRVEYRAGAVVWQVTGSREIGYSYQGQAQIIRPRSLILATGAMERPMPIPGWTLPGVMTAGAAQTLLKSSALAAEGALFAGSGPLLYLIAYQYLKAGLHVEAIVDTTPRHNRWRALPHLPGALLNWQMLNKGRKWISEIRALGTPILKGAGELRVLGDEVAEGLAWRRHSGAWQEVSSSHVFLHQGVVPNINLSMAAGLQHDWDAIQICWRPRCDDWGRGSCDKIFIAGDGAGVGGAAAAHAAGRIAAIGALSDLGLISQGDRDREARGWRAVMRREMSFRPFLDAWFRPPDQLRVPDDENTTVCRCEELTLKDIRDAIAIGLNNPNSVKSFCRSGMGPCQGRFCGLTLQEIIARDTGRAPGEVGYYRLRPPIKPVPLNELANIEFDPVQQNDRI